MARRIRSLGSSRLNSAQPDAALIIVHPGYTLTLLFSRNCHFFPLHGHLALAILRSTILIMPPLGVDEWMDNFVAKWAPNNEDPRDLPSVGERKAVSDYLHGTISVEEAAIVYTRDIISGQIYSDVWFLIYYIAQGLLNSKAV